MRKILNLVLVFVLIIGVTACGGKEEVRTFEGISNGVKVQSVFTTKGDKIVKQNSTNTIIFEDFGITEQAEKDAIKEQIQTNVDSLNEIEGVTDTIEVTDESLVETIEIDYEKADIKQLSQMGVIQVTDENIDYLSMKKTAEAQIAAGLQEVK